MSKQVDWPYVINLGNSIIGVSVLAMPFCFKECGILLGIFLVLGCAWLASVSCSLLMKAAITSKKRSYEFLALHIFGGVGKLAVEVSIIGLLLGTCTAFHVVIGDLGPAIISKMFSVENTPNLRSGFMVMLALFVALPLGLMKNIESLSNISAISLGFYCVFVAEVFSAAFPNIWSGVWVSKVVLWNPEGVFKCLPIFSLAFGCQTQLFVMYDALPEPSLSRMNSITKNAVSMCTGVYVAVGYFGYIAFCDEEISGDVLMNFRPTIFSEAVKLGFVLSVAVSFPLVIFPCRTSIHTLIFAKAQGTHENFGGSSMVPEPYFKIITAWIVLSTLVVGLLVPNIEFVLALTGATMGAMICFICPAVMFISLMSMSKTSSKSTAQIVLFLGVTILLASTYVTLYSEERTNSNSVIKVPIPHDHIETVEDKVPQQPPDGKPGVRDTADQDTHGDDVIKKKVEISKDEQKVKPLEEKEKANKKAKETAAESDDTQQDKRQEPPVPHAPLEVEKDEPAVKEETKEKPQDSKKDTDKKEEESEKALKDTAKEVKEKDTKKDADAKRTAEKDKKSDDPEKEEKKKGDGEKRDEETGKLLEELKAQRQEQQALINQQKAIIAELQKHKDDAHGAENQEVKKTEDSAKQVLPQQLGLQQPHDPIQPQPQQQLPLGQQQEQNRMLQNPANLQQQLKQQAAAPQQQQQQHRVEQEQLKQQQQQQQQQLLRQQQQQPLEQKPQFQPQQEQQQPLQQQQVQHQIPLQQQKQEVPQQHIPQQQPNYQKQQQVPQRQQAVQQQQPVQQQKQEVLQQHIPQQQPNYQKQQQVPQRQQPVQQQQQYQQQQQQQEQQQQQFAQPNRFDSRFDSQQPVPAKQNIQRQNFQPQNQKPPLDSRPLKEILVPAAQAGKFAGQGKAVNMAGNNLGNANIGAGNAGGNVIDHNVGGGGGGNVRNVNIDEHKAIAHGNALGNDLGGGNQGSFKQQMKPLEDNLGLEKDRRVDAQMNVHGHQPAAAPAG